MIIVVKKPRCAQKQHNINRFNNKMCSNNVHNKNKFYIFKPFYKKVFLKNITYFTFKTILITKCAHLKIYT